jgi:hypothetical protein
MGPSAHFWWIADNVFPPPEGYVNPITSSIGMYDLTLTSDTGALNQVQVDITITQDWFGSGATVLGSGIGSTVLESGQVIDPPFFGRMPDYIGAALWGTYVTYSATLNLGEVYEISGSASDGWYGVPHFAMLDISATKPVPEPSTMFLLGSGLLGLGVYGRKKFLKK